MNNFVKSFGKLCVFTLCFASLLIFDSCNVGLGESVDTKAPEIKISYPPLSSVIRDSFVLYGTWNDDKGVSGINVSIVDTSSKKEIYATTAVINPDKTWSVELNNWDSENPDYFRGWQFADGTYKISATVYDAAGNYAADSQTYDIDNTPPVFVISNPGVVKSKIDSEGMKPSAYGSLFTIEGTISDDHIVSTMDVAIYNKETGELVSREIYEGEQIETFREE